MKYIIITMTCIFTFLLQTAAFNRESVKLRYDHSADIITIFQQDLIHNDAAFEQKLRQGIKDGIFYVEIPTECQNLIFEAIDFGNSFYHDEAIKNHQFPDFSGYHNREHAQVESYYLERFFWKEIFSKNMHQLSMHINILAEYLLKKIMFLVLPQTTIHQLDELDDNEKQYYFICNHYRSEKNLIGLAPHKDFGFITLLSMNKPGFIAHLHGVWGTILPKENYFLVNLGKALETLVNDTSKLTAVLHAVEYITDLHGRVSFGLSVEGNLDSPVYKLSENDSLEIIHPTFQAYLEECFKKTYGMINYEI